MNVGKLAIAAALTVAALSGCTSGSGSSDAGSLPPTPTSVVASASSPTEPPATPAGQCTVEDLAGEFIDVVNARDTAAVARFAPGATVDTVDFLIGGGPYDNLSCTEFNGAQVCRVSNQAADFEFGVDTASGTVVDLVYVGGA